MDRQWGLNPRNPQDAAISKADAERRLAKSEWKAARRASRVLRRMFRKNPGDAELRARYHAARGQTAHKHQAYMTARSAHRAALSRGRHRR